MKIAMRGFRRTMAGAAVFLICLAAAQAQGPRPAEESAAESLLYLRSPESRLARLEQSLGLTKTQKTKALRILRKVDASVKAAVDDGNDEIRRLLSEEQQAQFDELRPDTEMASQSRSRPAMRLTSLQGQSGGRGRGGMGGQGGQGMGPRGGMGGMDSQGMSGGGRGGQGPGFGGGQGSGPRGYCGDGTCDQVERNRGLCPQDCGQSQD